MAGKSLIVEMVTPERAALQTQASFVVLPAFEGEMGILPDHAPVLTQLQAGEVRVTEAGEVKYYAVSGGFAEVRDNKVSLFAETAELADQINAERAAQALERAKAETLRKDVDPLTLAAAEAALRRAQVRLMVASKRAGPRRKSGEEQPHL